MNRLPGKLGEHQQQREDLARMMQHHKGPDDEGGHFEGPPPAAAPNAQRTVDRELTAADVDRITALVEAPRHRQHRRQAPEYPAKETEAAPEAETEGDTGEELGGRW